MAKKEKVLVALDNDSKANEVVRYVGRLTAGKGSVTFCLLHVLPPFPPELREFRGSEDAKIEEKLDRDLDLKCERWRKQAEVATQGLFKKATVLLNRAGIPSHAIETFIWRSVNYEDFIEDILDAAKEKSCQTIVVGRSSFSWLKEMFHRHAADELVKKARGVTIWVVEVSAH